jgi:TetR/AcrR family transcriptional regulator, transcriptional repressor for nem operon
MRYDKEHKARTRERIELVASQRFREEGIDGIGLVGLMESAGLTHGGFYAHFDSKETLVAAAIEAAFAQMAARRAARGKATGQGRPAPVAFAKAYLTEGHRDDRADGCPVAGLATDVTRRSDTVREAFTKGLLRMIDGAVPEGEMDAKERQNQALAAIALSVGSLILARAVSDPKLSKQLLAAGVFGAEKIAG